MAGNAKWFCSSKEIRAVCYCAFVNRTAACKAWSLTVLLKAKDKKQTNKKELWSVALTNLVFTACDLYRLRTHARTNSSCILPHN